MRTYTAVDEERVELIGRGLGGDELVDPHRTGVERTMALEFHPRGQARTAEDVLALARSHGVVHEALVDRALELAGLALLDAFVQHDRPPLFLFGLMRVLLVDARLCLLVGSTGRVVGVLLREKASLLLALFVVLHPVCALSDS